jgi:hypothetical protein
VPILSTTRVLSLRLLRLAGAALGLVFPALCVAQTTTAATTVQVGKFSKRTVGVVSGITPGDAACYLSLQDEQGKAFEELADFAICEKPNLYLGRRVSLSYTLGSVMAQSCQGDPACQKTQAVALVTSLKVLNAKSTASQHGSTSAPNSFCSAQESIVFSCRTGAKMVSICASQDASAHKGYLQYRFGQPDSREALELRLPETPTPANKAASGESVPFAGGGGSWLRFKKGAYAYVAYTGIGKWGPRGEIREKHGLVVERDGKRVAHLPCAEEPQSQLGPEWFEKLNIKTRADEDFLFPN